MDEISLVELGLDFEGDAVPKAAEFVRNLSPSDLSRLTEVLEFVCSHPEIVKCHLGWNSRTKGLHMVPFMAPMGSRPFTRELSDQRAHSGAIREKVAGVEWLVAPAVFRVPRRTPLRPGERRQSSITAFLEGRE